MLDGEKCLLKAAHTKVLEVDVANCCQVFTIKIRSFIYFENFLLIAYVFFLFFFARYSKAVGLAASEEHQRSFLKSESVTGSLTASTTRQTRLSPSPSAPVLNTKSHFRTSSDTTKIEKSEGNADGENIVLTEEEVNQRLIWIYLDAEKMTEEKLSENGILSELVWPVLQSHLTAESAKDYFIESLEESRLELRQNLTQLSNIITNRVSEKSSAYLKQVADIPR